MNPDEMMNEITAALRDAIWETPDASHLEDSPEDVYQDLAARLIVKLMQHSLTITGVLSREDEIERKRGEAASRILGIFSNWLTGHPERHFVTGVDRSGKFEIIVRTAGQTDGYFRGETVQDAYAQAAQTISFSDGEL